MTLPMVWLFRDVGLALWLMIRTGDQVAPKSVVRVNSVSSVNAEEWTSASMLALGPIRTSQTAYASPGVMGSAVTDSLSWKNWKLLSGTGMGTPLCASACIDCACVQVSPPS